MKLAKKLQITGLAMSIAAVTIRLIPHPANFTPMGATAIFGGAKFSRPWNYLLPLFLLFLTDLILGFHTTMPYVYGGFFVSAWLGERFLQPRSSTTRVGGLAVLSSTIFFLLTNFGVWAQGGLYPHTFYGLIECYVAGLPFWGNMLLADTLFGVGYFKLFAYFETTKLPRMESRLLGYLGGNK